MPPGLTARLSLRANPSHSAYSPERVAAVKAMAELNLLNDPKEYLTRVQCPALAFFGEGDVL